MRSFTFVVLEVTFCFVWSAVTFGSVSVPVARDDAKGDMCTLPPKTGPCRAAFPRFYYNSTTRGCSEFIYGGCNGNDNNFATEKECLAMCYSSSGVRKDQEQANTAALYRESVRAGINPAKPIPFFSPIKKRKRSIAGHQPHFIKGVGQDTAVSEVDAFFGAESEDKEHHGRSTQTDAVNSHVPDNSANPLKTDHMHSSSSSESRQTTLPRVADSNPPAAVKHRVTDSSELDNDEHSEKADPKFPPAPGKVDDKLPQTKNLTSSPDDNDRSKGTDPTSIDEDDVKLPGGKGTPLSAEKVDDKRPPGEDQTSSRDDGKGQEGEETSLSTHNDDVKGEEGKETLSTHRDDGKGQEEKDPSLSTHRDDGKGKEGEDTSLSTHRDDVKRPEGNDSSLSTHRDDGKGQEEKDSSLLTHRDDGKGQEEKDTSLSTHRDDVKRPEGNDSSLSTHRDDGKGQEGEDTSLSTHGDDGKGQEGKDTPLSTHRDDGKGQEEKDTSISTHRDDGKGQEGEDTSLSTHRDDGKGQEGEDTSLSTHRDDVKRPEGNDSSLSTHRVGDKHPEEKDLTSLPEKDDRRPEKPNIQTSRAHEGDSKHPEKSDESLSVDEESQDYEEVEELSKYEDQSNHIEERTREDDFYGQRPGEHQSSHFAAFFLTSIVMVFTMYVVYHNRQKIIAIVIEGRSHGNGRRRGYRKLETNVEEAMPSMKSANSTYVY